LHFNCEGCGEDGLPSRQDFLRIGEGRELPTRGPRLLFKIPQFQPFAAGRNGALALVLAIRLAIEIAARA